MRRRRLPPSVAIALIVAAVAAGLGLGLHSSGVLERLELAAVDAMFPLRADREKAAGVILVGVDQPTMTELDRSTPPRRRDHATVVRRLRTAGARAIAYDFQFTEPSAYPADDERLAVEIGRTTERLPVVLATAEVADGGDHLVFGGPEGLAAIGGAVGNAQMPSDNDGVTRHLTRELTGMETFPVVTASTVTGRRVPRAAFGGAREWIDFAGPPGTVREVSFVDVLRGRVPASAFRGRIVVVGATAVTFQDLHSTATSGSSKMTGPELQAQAIASVLRGMPLRDAPRWAAVALIVLAAIAGAFGVTTLRRSRSRLWIGIAVAGVTVTALLGGLVALVLGAFKAGWILPVTPTLLAFGLSLMLSGALLVSLDAHERVQARLRDAFGRFLPEQAIEQVIESGDRGEGFALRGVECDATVLFADLRGFSTRVENQGAREVIEFLDRYLTGMSEAILDHGGTVVSYMGDGIMAVFGAPLAQEDHADRAVAAAMEMLGDRIGAFNAYLAEHEGGEACRIAIGLHSGPVASGTVGSERRMEYAAVGHTTNVAARLEAMTRTLDVDLLLSAVTRARLRSSPPLIGLGQVTVKGIARPVEVFSLEEDATGAGMPAVTRQGTAAR